ncbi:LysR family transcriptional regulator [Mesorhizobium sp.]|uniref:LysR family transcriptional regulator n=1 Tax=Mesorhizobium sp. TaxID=1871066 RepID=UPI000FE98B47|nr:LysR family transcriptional regulator [Mesorhizobium sp.]RWK58623.1 MAG: LysR family transcriptional regulator [Mesorhizobium sp.]RWM44502.1 MAG: LysR family transcriptional regulator [Mesorhizobium sp.]RWM46146.1 MAG: LysR family transcriptional regulator [Mesorhizobium sp.]RWM48204.1 MAG: LysR family transcriptional regulator [Mesorhizobium sp.]RWM89565.1 MAG: LysR family transcriptional regulator [Mesorhizobium sp.]
MQIELLDTFIDLIETRNFNRTAERLGVTQSTVSSRIRSLETLLEKQLFIRNKSGTEPTVAGIRFEEHARAVKLRWLDARREIQSVGKFDRLIRIGIQHELYERVLEAWLEWVRATMPKLAIYVEIDYSNQMILDLTTGSLDLAVLYSPQHLPDMHYEQIAEESFLMVSTRRVALSEITPSDYIRANYSAYFNRAHKQMLPELENSPVSTGNGGAVAYLLRSRGGTAFVTETVATKLRQEGVVQTVADAPKISHPIYSAVHVRHHHSHTHIRLLKALKLMAA